MSETLFPGADERAESVEAAAKGKAAPRIVRADRRQVLLRPTDLESLLPADHRARAVWSFCERLDLSRFYAEIAAVEGHGGRPAIDPRVLLCLWIFATAEGVGSARQLARLCEEHAAYQWICGGITPNHHALSDFRVQHAEAVDELLTQSVALLLAEGLVTLDRVAQDGIKVRASAGTASFRRKSRLEKLRDEAAEQVRRLKDEIDDDPGAGERRRKSAVERAAKEREERVGRALSQWQWAADGRSDGDTSKVRVSTTDPEARVMKMGDGGYRPAFNGQYVCDTKSQVVLGVAITQAGNDYQQLEPMLDQIEARYGKRPREALVDAGFASNNSLEGAEARGVVLLAPIPAHRRKPQTPAHARWIERMASVAGQAIYRERAASIECVNAQARNRGLQRLLVRGMAKARSVLLLFALAHNALRAQSLGAAFATA